MSTNKERIEILEAGLGGLQDGVQRMVLGMEDKFNQLEPTLTRMSEAFFSKKKEAPTTTLVSKKHILVLIEMTMTDTVWLCLLKQPNSSFQDFHVATQHSGLLERTNYLSSKPRQRHKRSLWHPFTLKVKPTNGGDG